MATTTQIFALAQSVVEELYNQRDLDALQISVWRADKKDPESVINVRFVLRVNGVQKTSGLEITAEEAQAESPEHLRVPMKLITERELV
jgi:hypothetical protein